MKEVLLYYLCCLRCLLCLRRLPCLLFVFVAFVVVRSLRLFLLLILCTSTLLLAPLANLACALRTQLEKKRVASVDSLFFRWSVCVCNAH